MNPSHPTHALQTVLERAVAERDEATAQLYLLLENARRLQSQREQLLTYRAEYQTRWITQFKHQAAIEVVHSYQSFVERLDHALEQLAQQVHAAQAQAEQARQTLMERETRVASVRKLLSRREQEQARHAAMREQRHSDERAAMALWHGTPALAVPASH